MTQYMNISIHMKMGYMNINLNVVFALALKIPPQVMGCGMGKAAASLGKKRERGRV